MCAELVGSVQAAHITALSRFQVGLCSGGRVTATDWPVAIETPIIMIISIVCAESEVCDKREQ